MDIYREIERFYKGAATEKTVIGQSLLKRNLYAVKVGRGDPVGIATYAMHGREWVSARLAITHAKRGVFGTVWLVPLVNPDGALLSQKGLASVKNSPYERFLSAYTNRELRLWKANARGVDLNVNFDARWGKGAKNLLRRGTENYVGDRPFSEPETRALKAFTEKIRPDYTLSFHTKGEEIYWYFRQSTRTCLRDFKLGQVLSQATGYPLRLTLDSAGGYKDWCISALSIPAYTVELGDDRFRHPLGWAAFPQIKESCGDALYALSHAIHAIKDSL